MTTKILIWATTAILSISPLWAEDRMATAELKGEWVVISCPNDDLCGMKAWTTAVRAEVITSLESVQVLRDDAVKPDSPYPVNIRIRIGEVVSGGVCRTLEIPAGTNETAPGLVQKLVDLIDRGQLVGSGRRPSTN